MSLSLYGIPDGQQKGQSKAPCPSVYAPTSALRSLSSVALSSAPASKTLSRGTTVRAIHPHFSQTISSTFLFAATNLISSTFLHEAIGMQTHFYRRSHDKSVYLDRWSSSRSLPADPRAVALTASA